VLLSIQALLSAPNPDDPLATDVAKHYKENEKDAQRGEFNASYAIYAGGEQYQRLRGKYPLFDRCVLGALFERYTGPAGSTFDRLRRNNIAWLSLSVLFGNP